MLIICISDNFLLSHFGTQNMIIIELLATLNMNVQRKNVMKFPYKHVVEKGIES